MWRRALQLLQRPTWGIAAPPETDSTSCIIRIEGSANKISNLKIDISARPTWPISNFGNSLWAERNSCAFRARTLIPFGIGPPQHIFVPLSIENGNILTFEIGFRLSLPESLRAKVTRHAAIIIRVGEVWSRIGNPVVLCGSGLIDVEKGIAALPETDMGHCSSARDRLHVVHRTH